MKYQFLLTEDEVRLFSEIQTWRHGSIVSEGIIRGVERKLGVQFPQEYRDLVKKNNGGYPKNKIFDTSKSKEHVLNNLIPIEKISDYKRYLPKDLIPFGADPFGNYLCFTKKWGIVYWLHETDEVRYVAPGFLEFLDSLYN